MIKKKDTAEYITKYIPETRRVSITEARKISAASKTNKEDCSILWRPEAGLSEEFQYAILTTGYKIEKVQISKDQEGELAEPGLRH